MVLTRSQILKDSPRKAPLKRTPRKTRAKKSDDSSSDEEGTIELKDIKLSLVENLGTIFEENEEHASLDSNTAISVDKTTVEKEIWDSKQNSPYDKIILSQSLAPILESNEDESSDCMEETEAHMKQNSKPETELMKKAESAEKPSNINDGSSNSAGVMRKHKFYFPPAKTLLPPSIMPTSIDAGMEIKDMYIDVTGTRKGAQKINQLYMIPNKNTRDSQLKDSVITADFETKHAIPAQKSLRQQRKDNKAKRAADAGKEWFNFKPPEMTDEVKRDLQILQMRGVLDPKRFYKHNDRKSLPKYFQVGKIMDNPVDFYSSRVPKKQRKPNLTEELLADAEFRKYQKRKYNEIQMKQKARGDKRRKVRHSKISKRKKEMGS